MTGEFNLDLHIMHCSLVISPLFVFFNATMGTLIKELCDGERGNI